MPDFWLDANSLIETNKGPYAFDIAPGFWKFLELKAEAGIIRSPSRVYDEFEDYGVEDDLLHWAKQQKTVGFFVDPDSFVQIIFSEVANFVQATYPLQQASSFLDGADPWIVAHAKAYGGRVVTFETPAPPGSRKPKIPDVCHQFGVQCLNVYSMARELGMTL